MERISNSYLRDISDSTSLCRQAMQLLSGARPMDRPKFCRNADRQRFLFQTLSAVVIVPPYDITLAWVARTKSTPMQKMVNFADITIAPGVRETASEDGAVLLDIEQGICFSLNPIGCKIWAMLKQQYSLEQIADSLEREFHAPRPELLADICDFAAQLEARHLIRHGDDIAAKKGWLAKLLWRRGTG
jgi:hypothetical protein